MKIVRLVLFALFVAGTAAAAERHVVLISIDGLMPRTHVDPAAGFEIPHLRALKAGGAWAEGVIGVFPSVT
ncbi:MAG TPA: alkaline phosphatase family protein, partial [Thermoanaerobaculia bacterium]|nr:alkaline phosphatase family protein [Thermoanaerobaculia bacterium]